MDKIELDLGNPIFTIYVDVSGQSRQTADAVMKQAIESFNIYKNITVWILPSDKYHVDCVYDGKAKNRSEEINHVIEEINSRVDILSNSKNFEDFKMNIRDWRINKLVDELQQEQTRSVE